MCHMTGRARHQTGRQTAATSQRGGCDGSQSITLTAARCPPSLSVEMKTVCQRFADRDSAHGSMTRADRWSVLGGGHRPEPDKEGRALDGNTDTQSERLREGDKDSHGPSPASKPTARSMRLVGGGIDPAWAGGAERGLLEQHSTTALRSYYGLQEGKSLDVGSRSLIDELLRT